MKIDLLHNPDFGALRVTFEAAGEGFLVRAGALVAKDPTVAMSRSVSGVEVSDVDGAPPRTSFAATGVGERLWLAAGPEGSIGRIALNPGEAVLLQPAAYLASTLGVQLEMGPPGVKGGAGEKIALLRATGQGELWLSAYGGLYETPIDPKGLVCDSEHLVAFTDGAPFSSRKVDGLKSRFLRGEGRVCQLDGPGRAWLQSRSPAALAAFLHPFRRRRRGG